MCSSAVRYAPDCCCEPSSPALSVLLSGWITTKKQLFNLDECKIAKSLDDDRLVSECRLLGGDPELLKHCFCHRLD